MKSAANQYKQAMQELKGLDLGAFEVPKEINTYEAHCYHCVCIKSKMAKDGLSVHIMPSLKIEGVSTWEVMQRQIKEGTFKALFAGQYNKVVVLHNPTLKAEPKADKAEPKADKAE